MKIIPQKQVLSIVLTIGAILLSACNTTTAPVSTLEPQTSEQFIFGVILVGPRNDKGWSEAHYTAGQYVEAHLPDSKMIYLDLLNPNARPETTLLEAVTDMVEQGAQLIFITSDDFSADTLLATRKFPDVKFVHISGNHAIDGKGPANLSNYMGKMIYGKMIAGCAAALATESGQIGYLGPLINNETLRLVDATYLGAQYCYKNYRQKDPAELKFKVEWIGYWFNMPGITYDPTTVANELFDGGVDVLLSGIDTPEAQQVTIQRQAAGDKVFVIPYDYAGACEQSPDVCLGVPYFNWGPGYLTFAHSVIDGNWLATWKWEPPDWQNLNNPDSSLVGFYMGNALNETQTKILNKFIKDLGDQSIELFKGPLYYQDGTPFLADGETATDLKLWYTSQLLAGMEGLSD